METLQKIEHWRATQPLQIGPRQARLDGEFSSLDRHSDQASLRDTETLELALDRMSCTFFQDYGQ